MLDELRAQLQADLLRGAKKLQRAQERADAYWVGFWTAFVLDRERFLAALSELRDAL